MLAVNNADFERLSNTGGVVGRRQRTGRFLNLVLRMDTKPFDDLRVRQAMALCLDRQTLVDLGARRATAGRPGTTRSPPNTATTIDHNRPVLRRGRGARRLLAEAGYPNGVKVELMCSTRPPLRAQLGVALKEMARAAGFDIEVKTIPHDYYIANVWKKGGFYVGSWNMRPMEDQMFTLLLTSDAPWADTAWNNATFDEIVYKARRTTNDDERSASSTPRRNGCASTRNPTSSRSTRTS